MIVHLHGNILDGQFADFLLNIGNGLMQFHPITGLTKIRETFCNTALSVEEFKSKGFRNIR